MDKRCVVISCFNYYETRTKSIIRHYKSEGYEVKYLIMDFNHFEKALWSEIPAEATSIKVPQYKKNMSISRLYSHYVFANKVYTELCSYRPNVIYSVFPPNSLVKIIAKYKMHNKCKVVLDCYDAWPESFPTKKFEKLCALPFKVWASLRNDYINCADLVLGVSQACVDFLKTITNKPIKLLKPSIDKSDTIIFDNNTSILTFCYLGNINHITNTNLLVSLLMKLSEKKKIELHVIGEGQNYHVLEDAFSNTNVELIGHGVVFDALVKKEIYAKCNFGLNVPKDEIQSTMSLKSVEYISAGLPFINCTRGDTWDIVEKYDIGFNFTELNIGCIIQKIINVDPERMAQLHTNVIEAYNKLFASQNLKGILDV